MPKRSILDCKQMWRFFLRYQNKGMYHPKRLRRLKRWDKRSPFFKIRWNCDNFIANQAMRKIYGSW